MDEKDKKVQEEKLYIPWSITSFDALDGIVKAQTQVQKMMELTGMMSQMAFNILDNSEVGDKMGALETMTKQYIERVKTVSAGGDVVNEDASRKSILKALTPAIATKSELPANFNEIASKTQTEQRNRFWTVKSADGSYRWFAVWSNNFKDRDNPPDIISKAAHLDYIERVQKGEVEYPELWHFHQEGTKWGQADMLAFVPLIANPDVGFTIASGTVDQGKEKHADFFAIQDEIVVGVSHGMKEVSRIQDGQGNNIITHYTTYEISDLPLEMAANPYTNFNVS